MTLTLYEITSSIELRKLNNHNYYRIDYGSIIY